MKNITTIILSAIILVVLSFAGGFKYRDIVSKEPTNSQTTNTNELFSKKVECQKYENDVEAKLRDSDVDIKETGAQTYNALNKIFYSPKANSCLYVTTETMFVNGKTTFETPTLRDVLSGETLLSGIREPGQDDYLDRMKQFEDGVKEYE